MAYFSNGFETEDYHERYCHQCVNWKDNGSGSLGCPIDDLHLFWNSDACNGEEAAKNSVRHTKWVALENFIPTSKDGLWPEQCRMFHSK